MQFDVQNMIGFTEWIVFSLFISLEVGSSVQRNRESNRFTRLDDIRRINSDRDTSSFWLLRDHQRDREERYANTGNTRNFQIRSCDILDSQPDHASTVLELPHTRLIIVLSSENRSLIWINAEYYQPQGWPISAFARRVFAHVLCDLH